MVFTEQAAGFGQATGYHVVNTQLVRRGQALRQSRDAHTRPEPAFAVIRDDVAANHLQQRRLAGAVASQQSDFFPAPHRQVHPVQQDLGTVVQLYCFQFE